MNTDLEKIHIWSQNWLVSFNPDKTKEFLLTRKVNPAIQPPLFMNNVQIQNVTSHKHLGLTLNQICTWHDHISDISSKAWKRINVFRSLMFKLDRKTLETIYFSFIRPTLEYADIVWDNCNMNEKYKLEQIQYEAAMIVTGATRSCSRAKLIEETINKFNKFKFLLTPTFCFVVAPCTITKPTEKYSTWYISL